MPDYPDSTLPTATSLISDEIGIAKDSTIQERIDIKTSELRDSIRGSGDKTLTDLETDLSDILNQLDITLSKLRDSLLDGSSLYSQLIDADETSDHEITLDKKGKNVLSVYAKADNATTFTLEFSNEIQIG